MLTENLSANSFHSQHHFLSASTEHLSFDRQQNEHTAISIVGQIFAVHLKEQQN